MEEIIKTDRKNAKKLNNFFSNVINHFDIPQYSQADQILNNEKDPVVKDSIKDMNHRIIIAMRECCTYSKFSFSFIEKTDILKEVKDFQLNKATQD